MSNGEIILAVGALIGPVLSAFGASALTNHRLARLERKVDEHNHFDSRIARCEESAKSAHHRINGMEGKR
jgi:hypothetical protein